MYIVPFVPIMPTEEGRLATDVMGGAYEPDSRLR